MSIDEVAFTVVTPAGRGPITVHAEPALRMAIIERGHGTRLESSWEAPGVYILLQQTGAEETNRAYVGKATKLRGRILGHERSKEGWQRALLVARDATHGFNTTQIGWLEGRLWELVRGLNDVELDNKVRPADDTLRSFDIAVLEQTILPIERVLYLLGITRTQGDETDKPESRRTRRTYSGEMSDLLAAGLIEKGAQLTSTSPSAPGTATVRADGSLDVAGAIYPTPSAAGSAVRDNKATNGWTFWALSDGRTLHDLRALLPKNRP